MIRLLNRIVIGENVHRSGWPWCVAALSELASGGILVDDFVERTFIYESARLPYSEPWVGIFHHPPFIPNTIQQIHKYALSNLVALEYSAAWRDSKRHLVKAITFSTEAASFLERWLRIPCFAIPHPTETPELAFSRFRYESNEDKKIVQIGMQLRNLRGVYQLPPIIGLGKARSKPYSHFVERDRALKNYWYGKRVDFGGVEELSRLPDSDYDRLLSANVVFLELFGAVANNVIVECIVRNTPILVNKLGAVVEYLGHDYPLFYSDLYRAAELLKGAAVEEAYAYLREKDKSLLSREYFLQCVKEAIDS